MELPSHPPEPPKPAELGVTRDNAVIPIECERVSIEPPRIDEATTRCVTVPLQPGETSLRFCHVNMMFPKGGVRSSRFLYTKGIFFNAVRMRSSPWLHCCSFQLFAYRIGTYDYGAACFTLDNTFSIDRKWGVMFIQCATEPVHILHFLFYLILFHYYLNSFVIIQPF